MSPFFFDPERTYTAVEVAELLHLNADNERQMREHYERTLTELRGQIVGLQMQLDSYRSVAIAIEALRASK